MIWRETSNNKGEVYFTDTPNGNRINPFDNEIIEIENLIENYNAEPKISNKTLITYVRNTMYIGDTEEIIKNYESTSPDISIEKNIIKTKEYNEVGEFNYELIRKELNYNKPIIFYQSNNSQNLMETGDLDSKIVKFKILVKNPTITINKVDYDTLSITPQGEANLDGAIYEVFNKYNFKIGEIIIENGKGTLKTGEIGKFTIKEKAPGNGYTLDNNIYEIELNDSDKLNEEITLSNKVIEKNIKIVKKYGTDNNFIGEANIDFAIYNNKNELISTITTDSNGEANIILPYGEYTIKQINTTKGYTIVDPFNIKIDNNVEEIIELKDYEIPVPNTRTNTNLLIILIEFIFIILC